MVISSSTKTCLGSLSCLLTSDRLELGPILFINKTEVKNCTAILLINKNKVWFLQDLPSLTSPSSLEYLQTELLCCRLAVVNKATLRYVVNLPRDRDNCPQYLYIATTTSQTVRIPTVHLVSLQSTMQHCSTSCSI